MHRLVVTQCSMHVTAHQNSPLGMEGMHRVQWHFSLYQEMNYEKEPIILHTLFDMHLLGV